MNTINLNHQQKQRIRSQTSEKMELLQLKESLAQLDWIVKTHSQEYKSNINMQTLLEIGLQIEMPQYSGISHMIKNEEIIKKEFQIYQGFLIYEMNYCINLNNCFINKKKIHQQHNTAFIISIQNNTGNLYLIYSHPLSQKEMFTYLKKYAKQSNFISKFRVKEVNFQNFYQISRKKTRKMYTAQLFNKQAIICQEQIDILDNYLKIIRSENIPNYLKMEALYEDKDVIYLVTEQFQGISFDLVLKQNRKFNQFDLANIIHDLLYTIRAQEEEDIFHGNISIHNIVLAIQNNKSQVYLINSNYKAYQGNNLDYFTETIPPYLIAPELQRLNTQPSTSTDLYQLGVTLALISFSTQSTDYALESMEFTMKDIYSNIPKQEARFIKQQTSQFQNLFSSSQLDLIKQLINQQPEKRITVQEALNHHWFVNIKEKIKNFKPHRPVRRKKLPSLKTIIEIREQSERDIVQKKFYGIEDPQSILSLCKKGSIQLLNDISPIMQKECSFSDLPSQSEFDVEEEHQLGNLIGNLNNLEYKMLPSQTSHQSVSKQMMTLQKLSSLQQ